MGQNYYDKQRAEMVGTNALNGMQGILNQAPYGDRFDAEVPNLDAFGNDANNVDMNIRQPDDYTFNLKPEEDEHYRKVLDQLQKFAMENNYKDIKEGYQGYIEMIQNSGMSRKEKEEAIKDLQRTIAREVYQERVSYQTSRARDQRIQLNSDETIDQSRISIQSVEEKSNQNTTPYNMRTETTIVYDGEDNPVNNRSRNDEVVAKREEEQRIKSIEDDRYYDAKLKETIAKENAEKAAGQKAAKQFQEDIQNLDELFAVGGAVTASGLVDVEEEVKKSREGNEQSNPFQNQQDPFQDPFEEEWSPEPDGNTAQENDANATEQDIGDQYEPIDFDDIGNEETETVLFNEDGTYIDDENVEPLKKDIPLQEESSDIKPGMKPNQDELGLELENEIKEEPVNTSSNNSEEKAEEINAETVVHDQDAIQRVDNNINLEEEQQVQEGMKLQMEQSDKDIEKDLEVDKQALAKKVYENDPDLQKTVQNKEDVFLNLCEKDPELRDKILATEEAKNPDLYHQLEEETKAEQMQMINERDSKEQEKINESPELTMNAQTQDGGKENKSMEDLQKELAESQRREQDLARTNNELTLQLQESEKSRQAVIEENQKQKDIINSQKDTIKGQDEIINSQDKVIDIQKQQIEEQSKQLAEKDKQIMDMSDLNRQGTDQLFITQTDMKNVTTLDTTQAKEKQIEQAVIAGGGYGPTNEGIQAAGATGFQNGMSTNNMTSQTNISYNGFSSSAPDMSRNDINSMMDGPSMSGTADFFASCRNGSNGSYENPYDERKTTQASWADGPTNYDRKADRDNREADRDEQEEGWEREWTPPKKN